MFSWLGSAVPEWKYDNLPVPENLDDYMGVAEQALTNREELINSDSVGWTVINQAYNESDVLVEQKKIHGSDVVIVRSIGYVAITGNKTLSSITKLIYDPSFEERKRLINNVVGYDRLKQITDDIHIARTIVSAGFIGISNREFLALRTVKQLSERKYLVAIQSINDISHYFDPNCVRGVSNCGISIEQISEEKIKIISVDHIDPKGQIPLQAVNSVKATAGDWIKKL